MARWKILAMVEAVVLVAGMLAFVILGTGFLKGSLERARGFLEEFFGRIELGVAAGRNVTISGMLSGPIAQTFEGPAEFVSLAYRRPAADFLIDGEPLNVSQASILLTGFRGSIQIATPLTLTLEGRAEGVEVNGVPLPALQRPEVKTAALSVDLLSFDLLDVARLRFEGLEGDLELGENALRLTGQPVELEAFLGDLNLGEGELEIQGRVKRALILGKTRLVASS